MVVVWFRLWFVVCLVFVTDLHRFARLMPKVRTWAVLRVNSFLLNQVGLAYSAQLILLLVIALDLVKLGRLSLVGCSRWFGYTHTRLFTISSGQEKPISLRQTGVSALPCPPALQSVRPLQDTKFGNKLPELISFRWAFTPAYLRAIWHLDSLSLAKSCLCSADTENI